MDNSIIRTDFEKKVHKKSFRLSDSEIKYIMKFAVPDNPSIGAALTNMILLLDTDLLERLVEERNALIKEISVLSGEHYDLKQRIIAESRKTLAGMQKTVDLITALVEILSR